MYKFKSGQASESPPSGTPRLDLSDTLRLDLSGWAYIRTERNK